MVWICKKHYTLPLRKHGLYNQKHLQLPNLPTRREDIWLVGDYTKTLDGKTFLDFDNRRIIGFATEDNLHLLCESTDVQGDGTFKSAPNLFHQLDTFNDYFVETWLGEDGKIPMTMWNVHAEDEKRTNNHMEGWKTCGETSLQHLRVCGGDEERAGSNSRTTITEASEASDCEPASGSVQTGVCNGKDLH